MSEFTYESSMYFDLSFDPSHISISLGIRVYIDVPTNQPTESHRTSSLPETPISIAPKQ
jgi:hypothetical protein